MNRTTDPGEKIRVLSGAILNQPEAQKTILDYFDGYINTMATVTLSTMTGHHHTHLDEDIKIQIQAALLKAICRFELEEILELRQRPRKKRDVHAQPAARLAGINKTIAEEKQ